MDFSWKSLNLAIEQTTSTSTYSGYLSGDHSHHHHKGIAFFSEGLLDAMETNIFLRIIFLFFPSALQRQAASLLPLFLRAQREQRRLIPLGMSCKGGLCKKARSHAPDRRWDEGGKYKMLCGAYGMREESPTIIITSMPYASRVA